MIKIARYFFWLGVVIYTLPLIKLWIEGFLVSPYIYSGFTSFILISIGIILAAFGKTKEE